MFPIGSIVTPKKDDKKLGHLHSRRFVVKEYNPLSYCIHVFLEDSPDTGRLSGQGINTIFGYKMEFYYTERFEFVDSPKIETIEDRIKKLYSKCKTTAHWV